MNDRASGSSVGLTILAEVELAACAAQFLHETRGD